MEAAPTQLLKGINYGTYSFTQDHLVAARDGRTILQIPLNKVANCTVMNKQDVNIEINVDEIDNDDCLCDMRFYIPMKAENKDEMDVENEEKDADKMEEEDDKEDKPKAKNGSEILSELILARTNLTSKHSDAIVTFEDLPFTVPRGKYTCHLSVTALTMKGPTFSHIIQYKNITRAFLLPKPDDVHMLFVLGLEKPLRQGNTSYQYLVMQTRRDAVETVKLKIPPDQVEQQLNEKLKEEYEGNLHDIVAKIFKSIIKINIIIPGEFESSAKHSGVKCSVKAAEGHLFFLTKSLIFIPKPVIYIKLDELKAVEFHRLGSGAQIRLFDITLILKSGQHSFSGIEKKELQIITDYFTSRKISVKTVNENANFQDEDLSDDEDADGNLKKRKAKVNAASRMEEEEDDDSDEEDEDFIAQEEDDSGDEDVEFDEEEDDTKPKKSKKPSAKEI